MVEMTYDIGKSYLENYERGPGFQGPPWEVPETPGKRFLGLPVRSRLGIAAGLLLNSKWVAGYGGRGYDILTYKTVRSSYRECYRAPNWVFVEEGEEAVYAVEGAPGDLSKASSAICFGMPSMSPAVWREDVARAKAGLGPGQVLIVSVVGTPAEGMSAEEMADDFVRCGAWAAEAGADAVEANLSCPNVCSAEGSIYRDAEFSRLVSERMREALGGKPLLLKAGRFESEDEQRRFLKAVNGAAQGIVLVNGIMRPVLRRDGSPVFGDYVKAGVVGRAIHRDCVEAVRTAAGITREERLDLTIVAVGGVSLVEDMGEFFEAGAGAVLMGSSPMYLPRLAVEAKRLHPEW